MASAGVGTRLSSHESLERGRLATISGVTPRRPIIVVVGMHRSGTSLCSHLLSTLGVDMADQIAAPGHPAPTPDNPKGHWERWEIVEFHNRILSIFNRNYYTPFHDFALPLAWWADPRVVQIRHEIGSFLNGRMGETTFGFKDPRTTRLMPVWHNIAADLKLAPKIVLCVRNPAQVARSLQARDALEVDTGEYRWLNYMMDFFRHVGSLDFCTIEYENWFIEPRTNFAKLTKFLDLEWSSSETELDLVLSDIIDPALRHDGSGRQEASQPLTRSLYKLALRAGEDPPAREQISYMASQFVGFQQIHKPFYREFETLVETAGRKAVATETRLAEALGEIEAQQARLAEIGNEGKDQTQMMQRLAEEAARLRGIIADREAALEATETKNAAAEVRAEEAEEKLAMQLTYISEIESKRDDQAVVLRRFGEEIARLRIQVNERETARATAQATLETYQKRIVEVEGEWDQQALTLRQLGEETACLRRIAADGEIALETAKADATAIDARLAQMLVGMEAQGAHIVELETERDKQVAQVAALNFAATERESALEAANRKAAVSEQHFATALTEIGSLRGELTKSKEAAREHATAQAAMQATVSSLQSELSAARQVGQAVLTALRHDTAGLAVPGTESEICRRRSFLSRFFGLGRMRPTVG